MKETETQAHRSEVMPQIGFCVPRLTNGGRSQSVYALAQALCADGWRVRVLSGPVSIATPETGPSVVSIFPKRLNGRNALRNTIRIRREIHRGKLDIVLSHGLQLTLILLLLRRLRLLRAIVVVVDRSNLVYRLQNPRRRPMSALLYSFAFRNLVSQAALIITNSEDALAEMRRVAGNSVPLIAIHNNLSARELVTRVQLPSPRPELSKTWSQVVGWRIVMLGRLNDHEKDMSLAIRAMAELNAQSQAACTLVIFGDGPDKRMLQQLASDLNISDKIVFAGQSESALYFLSRADLCLFTSRFEGDARTVIEAQALGVPTVVAPGVGQHMQRCASSTLCTVSESRSPTDVACATVSALVRTADSRPDRDSPWEWLVEQDPSRINAKDLYARVMGDIYSDTTL